MEIPRHDQYFNASQNNGTDTDFHGPRAVTTLIIYGTMALFWFFYIVFLLKICRYYFKDKWLKDDLKKLEERKKRMKAVQNGRCLSGKGSTTTSNAEGTNYMTEEHSMELKETKVAFKLPESSVKQKSDTNLESLPPKEMVLDTPKIDFVEYI